MTIRPTLFAGIGVSLLLILGTVALMPPDSASATTRYEFAGLVTAVAHDGGGGVRLEIDTNRGRFRVECPTGTAARVCSALEPDVDSVRVAGRFPAPDQDESGLFRADILIFDVGPTAAPAGGSDPGPAGDSDPSDPSAPAPPPDEPEPPSGNGRG